MDRQTILAAAIAILGMFVLGGVMLDSKGSDAGDRSARPRYAPGDIRYNLQQAEIQAAQKKKRKTPAPAPEQFATDGSTSSGASNGDGSSDDPNEEPSVFDHPPQEEPPLD